MTKITNRTYGEERALYALSDAELQNCTFAGPADGESALKEASNLLVDGCLFALRYPLWHTAAVTLKNCEMTDTCRAAVWYAQEFTALSSVMNGIKVFRECDALSVLGCKIVSPEAFWRCRGLLLSDTEVTSEYPFFECKNVSANRLSLTGKYSFQYAEGGEIKNSVFHTKDAFWHAKNLTVTDSELDGEYLGWYSENLRLVRCKIKGTQPLCYCKGLVLEDCTTEGCDLAFEKSEVTATVLGKIESVKNPACGKIAAESIGEVILDARFCDPSATEITTKR